MKQDKQERSKMINKIERRMQTFLVFNPIPSLILRGGLFLFITVAILTGVAS